jgi:hypothetical protein
VNRESSATMSSKKTRTKKTATSKRLSASAYAQSFKVASDTSKNAKARITEIARLATAACEDDDVFSGTLAILRDTSEPAAVRRAALRTLQASSFSVVAFNARRTNYLAALRGLSKDQDLEIRQSVLGILARERDGRTQQLLLEGLEDASQALLPPEKALQLLGYDVHSEAYPVARRIVKKPPNPAAKREALRLLGGDTGSTALFESVLRNKKEDAELRRIAATALQTLKPAALQEHARDIVLDDSDDDEVRATSLTVLSQFGDAAVIGRDDELRAKTSKLRSAGSSAVKRGAKAFFVKYHNE